MKKKLLILTVVFLVIQAGYCQTYVSGGIYSNTTWTKDGNPYIVTGDVVVFSDVELTIEPGVLVKFDAGTGIEFRGDLRAIGTIQDTIVFTSNLSSPGIGSWKGFEVIGTTSPLGVGDQILMEYCKGMYAGTFADLDYAYHGPYVFKHCYFAFNDQVNEDGGIPSTTFEDCTFVSNNDALVYGDNTRVSNSSFINNVNGVDGFQIIENCFFSGHSGIALSPYGSTEGCIVQNNNIGVSCYFNSANNYFVDNNISYNAVGVEILTYFNGSITFTGNTICENSSYNIMHLDDNNADLSLNCWCSTDSAYIRSTIYDGYVNISYGLVDYMPLADSCPQITETSEILYSASASVRIFPNPFYNFTTIQIDKPDSDHFSLTIFNSVGEKVKQINMISGNTITLYREDLPSGLYFLQLRNEHILIGIEKIIIAD